MGLDWKDYMGIDPKLVLFNCCATMYITFKLSFIKLLMDLDQQMYWDMCVSTIWQPYLLILLHILSTFTCGQFQKFS
jgi:hypothetical protein